MLIVFYSASASAAVMTARRGRCRSAVTVNHNSRRRRSHDNSRCRGQWRENCSYDLNSHASAVIMSSVMVVIPCVNICETDHAQSDCCYCQPDPFSFVVLHNRSPSLEFFHCCGFHALHKQQRFENPNYFISKQKNTKNPDFFSENPDFSLKLNFEGQSVFARSAASLMRFSILSQASASRSSAFPSHVPPTAATLETAR